MPFQAVAAIVETVATAVGASAVTAGAIGATIAGIPAEIGAVVGGGLLGGAVGGAVSGIGTSEVLGAITGQDPIKSLEYGAITGGVGGALTPALETAGISPSLAQATAGALGGLGGAAATGGNLATGALTGGVEGLAAGALRPSASAGGGGGGPGSAAAGAAPAGVASGSDISYLTGSTPDSTSALPGGASTSALPGDVGAGAAAGGATPASAGIPAAPTTDAAVAAPAGGGGGGDVTPVQPISASTPSDINPGALSPSFTSPVDSGNAITVPSGTISQPVDLSAPAPKSNVTGGGGSTASGGGSTMSNLLKNPMFDVAALGFGTDLLRGAGSLPYQGVLQGRAGQLGAQGEALLGYEQSGQLPPGLQANLDAAHSAAEASIRSQYAARGMSGSSAEAQDLQSLALRTQSQGAQIAIQLAQQGLNEVQLSDAIYGQLMQEQIAQDNALSASVSNLAGAIAGFSQPYRPTAP